jgi:pseudaminic acid cytidylyltransferase
MDRICIIPARGGSKRIPRKNIKNFLGKPIIAYSIDVAVKSGLFDEVMVSTEDAEIASIAAEYGAKVPFLRSSKCADDFTTTFEVLQEVILHERYHGAKQACCIYPTSPLINTKILLDGLTKLEESNFDSVFAIQKFGFPIQRAFRLVQNNIQWISPRYALQRSQDIEQSYHDAGQFYWFKTSIIHNEKSLLTSNSGGLIIDELHGQDIDNETDWKMAELKYKLLQNECI